MSQAKSNIICKLIVGTELLWPVLNFMFCAINMYPHTYGTYDTVNVFVKLSLL